MSDKAKDEKVLCQFIGGPADGQEYAVDPRARYVQIPTSAGMAIYRVDLTARELRYGD